MRTYSFEHREKEFHFKDEYEKECIPEQREKKLKRNVI